MADEDRVSVMPTMCAYHDEEKYTIDVELAGVDKKDIDLRMTDAGFCVKAPRKDIEYFGCWVLAHDIDPAKAKASFDNGLLTITAPFSKPMEGVKVSVK